MATGMGDDVGLDNAFGCANNLADGRACVIGELSQLGSELLEQTRCAQEQRTKHKIAAGISPRNKMT